MPADILSEHHRNISTTLRRAEYLARLAGEERDDVFVEKSFCTSASNAGVQHSGCGSGPTSWRRLEPWAIP
jgi:hypothetical protein